MQILKFPNPLLFQRCEEVTVFGEELKVILDSMYETMKKANGIGLAANQVGLTYRMFVMDDMDGKPVYLVNPVITKTSKYASSIREGCLSAPGEFLNLNRSSWVTVSYQNEIGDHKSLNIAGVWAVCIQHELEHLDGLSFLENKNLTKAERKDLAKKWKIK